MGLFRSNEMRNGTLLLPHDRARHFMELIGRRAHVQFTDMHGGRHAPKRAYKRYVQRIDEMERILRFLFEELKKRRKEKLHQRDIDGFLEYDHYYKLENVESELYKAHKVFRDFSDNHRTLLQARQSCIEERHVLENAAASSWNVRRHSRGERRLSNYDPSTIGMQNELAEDFGLSMARVNHISGVIKTIDADRFARFLFRSTRGNTFTNIEELATPILDPQTGKEVRKSVFDVHFQDTRMVGGSAMYNRVMLACKQFNVSVYPWVTDPREANRRIAELNGLLLEKERWFQGYNRFMDESTVYLLEKQMTGNSRLEDWRLFCLKEKSIYAGLNFFDGDTALHCEIWFSATEEESLRALLQRHSTYDSTASIVSDRTYSDQPPTYFVPNELTAPVQELVHTYGVPRYRELTPVIFSIVTFPFIFGVMFGDVGHGILLFLVGVFLIKKSDTVKHVVPALYLFRYMILMMGFFSAFAGFMYNDFFSLGLAPFESRWEVNPNKQDREMLPLADITNGLHPYVDFTKDHGLVRAKFSTPYPFGIDPAWHGAENELTFLNSFKMKFSVILGVCHMSLGLCMRVANAVNEKNYLDLFGECVPMIIFFASFFVYMDYLILLKWVTVYDWPGAPGIINNLIAMAMFTPLATVKESDESEAVQVEFFEHEKEYEEGLMWYVVLSIPCLLLVKPCVITYQQRRANSSYQPIGMDDKDPQAKHKRIDMGELWIHQVIETIEYVLSSVSHTASYLRLWALSLAHQQLSVVLFQYTMGMAMMSAAPWPLSGISIALTFAFFAVVTVVKFLCMDVMECFLHTLRLHWVEFQSKFYRADGYAFEPYNLQKLLEASYDEFE